MPSVTHSYSLDDTVYYIDDGAIKSGTVLKVVITISDSGTTINYTLQVGTTSVVKEESSLYANCKANGGYQDAVFTYALSSSTVVIPVGSALAGSTLTGSVTVDGGTPIALSYLVGTGSPLAVSTAVTVQDILNNLNGVLNPYADAFIYQNNIRIKSRSTGAASTVSVEDGTGSPLDNKYFENLVNYTGLSASTVGTGDGALEALASNVCT